MFMCHARFVLCSLLNSTFNFVKTAWLLNVYLLINLQFHANQMYIFRKPSYCGILAIIFYRLTFSYCLTLEVCDARVSTVIVETGASCHNFYSSKYFFFSGQGLFIHFNQHETNKQTKKYVLIKHTCLFVKLTMT